MEGKLLSFADIVWNGDEKSLFVVLIGVRRIFFWNADVAPNWSSQVFRHINRRIAVGVRGS
jgi:hypothetical protein